MQGVVCGRGRNPTLRVRPAIFACEIDVFPSQRQDVSQQVGRRRLAVACLGADDVAEFHGVPEDDDGGEEIHAGGSVMLPFAGAVAYFTAPMETDGSL